MKNSRALVLTAASTLLVVSAGCGSDSPSTSAPASKPATSSAASSSPSSPPSRSTPARADPCQALTTEQVSAWAHSAHVTPNDTHGSEGAGTQISCSYLGGKDGRDVVFAASYGAKAKRLTSQASATRSMLEHTAPLNVPGAHGYIGGFSAMRPSATAFAHWGRFSVMASVGGPARSVSDPAVLNDLRSMVGALKESLTPADFKR